MTDINNKEAIVDFWLGEAQIDTEESQRRSKLWYGFDAQTDQQITNRFKAVLLEAETGKLNGWTDSPEGSLALVLLLDQFSRNIYRGTRDAFRNDELALNIAKKAIEKEQDKRLSYIGRVFLYHPFEHSEDLEDQEVGVNLFYRLSREGNDAWSAQLTRFLDFAIEHRDIVMKFRRFPHRNKILGRKNTPQEDAFLTKDNRTYGQ